MTAGAVHCTPMAGAGVSWMSASYAEARARFLAAARRRGAAVRSWLHPTHRGANDEDLAMDVVRLGSPLASAVIVVSSGVHGVEGFCGSGCQLALLNDDDVLHSLLRSGAALLLVHAVNPYGFSHLRRGNEHSIDINRNFVDHQQPVHGNTGYATLHPHLLPATWLPPAEAQAAINRYVEAHGMRQFQRVVTGGQRSHPDGLFFAGHQPAWSNLTLRQVLREHGADCQRLAWIDIHTGLGPTGHGEKIFAGGSDQTGLALARACWGADVVALSSGESVSAVVAGGAASCLVGECPHPESTAIALEFGTLPQATVLDALRADQWLCNNPQASAVQHQYIKQRLLDAFYVDSPAWRGMVWAQARVAVRQALLALSSPFAAPSSATLQETS